MEFGLINIANAVIIAVIMIPNIIWALRCKAENVCQNRLMNVLEQIGRYGCMALMILPLGVWKFGFPSVMEMLIYLFGNAILLLIYLVIWIFYFKRNTASRAMTLAIVPACIFMLTAVTLRHWLLAAVALIFAIGHIYVTHQNTQS